MIPARTRLFSTCIAATAAAGGGRTESAADAIARCEASRDAYMLCTRWDRRSASKGGGVAC